LSIGAAAACSCSAAAHLWVTEAGAPSLADLLRRDTQQEGTFPPRRPLGTYSVAATISLLGSWRNPAEGGTLEKTSVLDGLSEVGSRSGRGCLGRNECGQPEIADFCHAELWARGGLPCWPPAAVARQMTSRSKIKPTRNSGSNCFAWLATDTPRAVVASVPSQMLFDDGRVRFSAKYGDQKLSGQPTPC